MIKNPYALVALLVLFICSSCSKSVEKETPGGIKFQVIKTGDGIQAKKGQSLVTNYIIKDSKDSVWVNSYDTGYPALIPVEDSTRIKEEIGILQIGRMITAADSLTFSLPLKKFFKEIYGGTPPPTADTTLTLTCTMRVKEIIETHKREEYYKNIEVLRKPKQKAKDIKKIEDYLAKNNIKAESDTSGIRYVIHKKAGGAVPTPSNCAIVSYKGMIIGDSLQTFDKNPNFQFPIGRVIPGWQLGLQKLGVGDSATFFVPSELGYGARGSAPVIPPDAVLLFRVKLISIGTTFDYQTRTCN